MSTCSITPEVERALSGQLERIVNSDLMKGSEALRRILLYLGDHAIRNPGHAIKEHTIATEVLGRSETFDPRTDSCVRVHVGRLRSRLVRYYAGPGAKDPLAVTIPLGTYVLVVHRAEEPHPDPAVPLARIPHRRLSKVPPWWREPLIQYCVIAVLCLVLGTLIGMAVQHLAKPAAGILAR